MIHNRYRILANFDEAADALVKLAKVIERCETRMKNASDEVYEELRAILSLLSSGPATAPTEGEK